MLSVRAVRSFRLARQIFSKHKLCLQEFYLHSKSDGTCSLAGASSSNRKSGHFLQNLSAVTVNHVRYCQTGSTVVKQKDDGFLELKIKGTELELPFVWLRDHCRCDVCYNHSTAQKNTDNYDLSSDLNPRKVNIEDNGKKISLEWADGHETHFDVDWLLEHSFSTASKAKTPFLLWDRKKLEGEPLPFVSYEDFQDKSQEGVKKTLYNLLRSGFSIIEGVNPSTRATQEAVEKITFLQETVFGQMWSFTSDMQRSDTAYTNLHLGPHNDTTYLTQPIGIQVFHCLWHDGHGGETLLVDGFHAADAFRKDHPDDFDLLTKTVVPHEYREWDKNHLFSHGTVLKVSPGSGDLTHIRFNPYDVAPIDTIPPRELPKFYSAYAKLQSYIKDPERQFYLKLHPGMVLLVNNWRVLHGRASFTGHRVVCGCYISRDDWLNKARVYNLI